MNSIKPFFSMVNEDLDLKTMAPGLVGLYAFCQAINKVGNQSPYPVPTLDIVSIEKVPEFKSNPVHFSFSKNSFKVYINPKLERVSMEDGGGHDLMHALTTNIAKKFARERPGADISNSSFKRSESGMTSKANLYRVSPKMFQGIAKNLAKYGIDYLSLKDGKAIKKALNVLYGKREYAKAASVGVGREGWKEKYDEIVNLISALTIGSRRTHFSPSLKMSSDAQLKNISKKKYGEEYGMSDSSDASNFDLPQYGAEENFGNTINNAIFSEIQDSRPINPEEALQKIQVELEGLPESELDISLQNNLYAKLEKFLIAVFETYNTLLGKYGSVVSKNRQ